MSLQAFIRAKAGTVPPAHIARQAGCSEAYVRDILRPPKQAILPPPPPPISPAAPSRSSTLQPMGFKRKPGARNRVWRTSLPGDVRRAIRAVADRHGVGLEALTDRAANIGNQALCEVRQEAYWVVYQIPEIGGGRRYGSPRIGSFFGGRDHTTILHGVRQHEKRLAEAGAAA